MNYAWLTTVFATMLFAVSTQAHDAKAPPAPQPVRPLSRMTAELTGPVSLRGEIPITLRLFGESDGEQRFNNYSFMFVLLDEVGHQVGGPHVFIREAVIVNLKLDGKEASYKPRLAFDPQREGVVVGRKYQLVCVMPQCDLASAVWFTLTK